MTYTLKIPAITVRDEGTSLKVYVDYHSGNGPEFCASFPTGIYAAYPEARERLYAEAQRRANDYRAEILSLYLNGCWTPDA